MIDRIAFAKVMGGFADRIGRALAPETAAMYFDVLSERLTTDEFLAGARIVFRAHAFNTWPAPQQFIDAANPQAAPRLSGAEVFEQVLALTNDPRIPDARARVLALGPVVERAFRAAGGLREFANVLEADVKWLRKNFIEAYEHAASHDDRTQDATIALGAVDPAVQRLVADVSSAKTFPLSGRERALPPEAAD